MFDIKIKKNKKIRTEKLQKEKKPRIYTGLIPVEEKEYFIENLSMLMSSGMDILTALDSIKKEVRSSQMKAVIDGLRNDVEAGFPIWKVLEETKFFPAFIISLIKIGERSGGLVKNLKMISNQQKKDRSFDSKIHSAMMYPVFVLGLTLIVGIGIAWFVLPRLTVVFDQLKVELPLITRLLVDFGKFISQYGMVAVPLFVFCLSILVYFMFFFSKTKFMGQTLLFHVPGIKKLIQETELARMGFILGTLLEAGIPIVDAIDSLIEASAFYKYKNLYIFLRENIANGNTFRQGFDSYKKTRKLIPATVQQMIIVGEKSGNLPGILLAIGEGFEEKIDNTSKNLATILEPILLVIVWLGVVSVALAVILPIYSLIGGLNEQKTLPAPTPQNVTETITTIEGSFEQEDDLDVVVTEKNKLEIIETGLGFLNVRKQGDSDGEKIGKVIPGQQYEYIQEKNGWYEIVLSDGMSGWVIGEFIKTLDPSAAETGAEESENVN
ncbi:MAG: Type IV pilus assembly protein tapC [uncultured bacterium]|nr:MAG: Type IV pilus assembly protein tapC [uncultured bacterium]